jgi:hypothetical protein
MGEFVPANSIGRDKEEAANKGAMAASRLTVAATP